MKQIAFWILALVIVIGPAPSVSAEPPTQDLEIILDASGSMRGKIGPRTKMRIAKQTLLKLAEQVSSRRDLALAIRVYGHQSPSKDKNCLDSRLEIPFGRTDPSRIKALLKKVTPRGYTPLAYSLQEARKDFDLKAQRVRTVVLITDGLETCGGDPCQAAREMAGAGMKVKLHVIGFDLKKEELAKLKCLTQPSGGLLLEARNSQELIDALTKVMKKSLARNLVVKVVSSSGKPREAHVEVFKAGTKKQLTIHQGKTTSFTLPAGRYDLVVRDFITDQVKELKNVEVPKEGAAEQEVRIDSGRLVAVFKSTRGEMLKGYVEIRRMEGEREVGLKGTYVIGKPQVFNVAPGVYRIEAQTGKLGRKRILKGVKVGPDQEVVKEFIFGQARLGVEVKDSSGQNVAALVEIWRVVDGEPTGSKTETYKSGRLDFTLEPGEYRIEVRRKTPKKAITLEGVLLKDGQELIKKVVF